MGERTSRRSRRVVRAHAGPSQQGTRSAPSALAGDYGATLEQVRNIVGIDPPTARRLIRGMASGGTIDEVSPAGQPRMRVHPESLRYALVHDVFFGGPGAFDVWQSVSCLDRRSIAARPIIGAVHRGVGVDRVRLLALLDWSDEQAATEYALLGPTEFQTAIEQAPLYRTRIAGGRLSIWDRPQACARDPDGAGYRGSAGGAQIHRNTRYESSPASSRGSKRISSPDNSPSRPPSRGWTRIGMLR